MTVREGRELLRRGAWGQARRTFEAVLAGSAQDATAAEGVAQAAWWLDDDAAVIERYEQAYRCHRAAGDARGAARAAAWLGNGALQLRGEAAVAQGWFRRADRLLAGLTEGAEHALLALFEGMAARTHGDLEQAIRLADTAMRIGRQIGSPDLELQGMALAGTICVGQGRVAEGMRLLDEAAAAALAGEIDEVGSVWMPSCSLVQGCEQVGDWDRAEQWCNRIMDFCRRYDLGSPFARCRTHYGSVLLSTGDWAGAETELVRAAEALEPRRPFLAGEAWARLGELRRRQGRRAEAAELFARAGSLPAARLGRAELHLDEDDPYEAIEVVRRLLDGFGPDARLDRAPALLLLVRAAAASPRPDLLAPAVDELTVLAEAVGSAALNAALLWAQGLRQSVLGDQEAAITLLDKAGGLFEQAADPYNAARTRRDISAARRSAGRPSLTARQREILRLIAIGLTNKEVAVRLTLSEHTVKRHITNILIRLDCPSRAAAVAYAARTGVL